MIMQDKQVIVFSEERFQLSAWLQCQEFEMMANANMFLWIPRKIPAPQVFICIQDNISFGAYLGPNH